VNELDDYDDLEADIAEAEAHDPGYRESLERMAGVVRVTTALWQQREALGLSVEEVAARAGLTVEDVEAVEDNDVDSSFERLSRYANAVGLQFDLHRVPA